MSFLRYMEKEHRRCKVSGFINFEIIIKNLREEPKSTIFKWQKGL